MDKAGRPTDNNSIGIEEFEQNSNSSSRWHWFGHALPRSEIVFFVQVILVYIVVIVSIVNITLSHDPDRLWITLLSSSIGYLLPSPTLKITNKT